MSNSDSTRPVVAIVPVKALAQAKSRLATVLPASERHDLALNLLCRTLRVVREAGSVAATIVVSADRLALQVAADGGALPLPEVAPGHIPALEQARRAALALHPEAIALVLAADLPALTPSDLMNLIALAGDGETAVIAPDRAEQGTNALGVPAGSPFQFRFGAHSFIRHVAEAERCGLRRQIYCAPGTAFDLDTPADLDNWTARRVWDDAVDERSLTMVGWEE